MQGLAVILAAITTLSGGAIVTAATANIIKYLTTIPFLLMPGISPGTILLLTMTLRERRPVSTHTERMEAHGIWAVCWVCVCETHIASSPTPHIVLCTQPGPPAEANNRVPIATTVWKEGTSPTLRASYLLYSTRKKDGRKENASITLRVKEIVTPLICVSLRLGGMTSANTRKSMLRALSPLPAFALT